MWAQRLLRKATLSSRNFTAQLAPGISLTWIGERIFLGALDDVRLAIDWRGEGRRHGNEEGDEECFGLHVDV